MAGIGQVVERRRVVVPRLLPGQALQLGDEPRLAGGLVVVRRVE